MGILDIQRRIREDRKKQEELEKKEKEWFRDKQGMMCRRGVRLREKKVVK